MKHIQNALAATLILLCLAGARFASGQEKIIHSFDYANGSFPAGGLLLDAKGNLFGTTIAGGGAAFAGGTVFELSPTAEGGWKERVLYAFGTTAMDSNQPFGDLVSDGKGDLFGVTELGGSYGSGTVFELSPDANGSWVEKAIYSFPPYPGNPNVFQNGDLVLDAHGNLYGTTYFGGSGPACPSCGTVFQLTPSSTNGTWTEKVIHSFGANDLDGAFPLAGLTIDPAGDLYGTTINGGSGLVGTAYELTRQSDGSWTEKILHDFGSTPGDGANPEGGLILDRDGSLYGTTYSDGAGGQGTVFKLSPTVAGGWTEKVFPLSIGGRVTIYTKLALNPLGELYGTTEGGGSSGHGAVFELVPQPDGTLSEGIVSSFAGTSTDGDNPLAGVIFDSRGNLYGTTFQGGVDGYGTVYQIEGVARPTPVETTTSPVAIPAGNQLVAGGPITLKVTIGPTSGPAIPTGTVTFTDPAGGSVTVPVIAGTATYYGTVPPMGTYSVFASYSGGPGFAPSQSATITRTVTMPPAP